MHKLLLAAALLAASAPTYAQNVKAKTKASYVDVQSLGLPERALGPGIRSVSTSVSVTDNTVEAVGPAAPRLEELGTVPGFPSAHSGDLHIGFIPSPPTYVEEVSLTEASTDHRWEILVPVYFTTEMRIPRPGDPGPPEPVGTCALLPLPGDPDYDYELVKMAVAPRARGLGLGEALGRRVLAEAVDRGARAVYLETNPVLKPAIALYRKLGFRDVEGHASPFARCGLQMGWRADR